MNYLNNTKRVLVLNSGRVLPGDVIEVTGAELGHKAFKGLVELGYLVKQGGGKQAEPSFADKVDAANSLDEVLALGREAKTQGEAELLEAKAASFKAPPAGSTVPATPAAKGR